MADKKDEWVVTAGGRRVRRSEVEGAAKAPGQDESEPQPVQMDTAECSRRVESALRKMARHEAAFSESFREIVMAANDMYGSHIAGKTATSDEWADTVGSLLQVMVAMDAFIHERIEAEREREEKPRGPVFIRIVDLSSLFGGPGDGGVVN